MEKQPIDLAHLARYTGGDKALDCEILRLFQTQCTQLLGDLETAAEKSDLKQWRAILHSLKGAARGIGAFSFADMVAQMEGHNPTASLLVGLRRESGIVSGFIDRYLA